MPRLIDADEFEKRCMFSKEVYKKVDDDGLYAVLEELRMTPTIDAEPVKHGHWNEAKDGTLWCSVCTSTGPYDEDYYGYVLNAPHYDYCPNCGAKMEEEDATETG